MKTARLTGLLYFVMSIIMIFGFMYAPRAFIVNGDAAATARKIIEGEQMYRITVLASAIGLARKASLLTYLGRLS